MPQVCHNLPLYATPQRLASWIYLHNCPKNTLTLHCFATIIGAPRFSNKFALLPQIILDIPGVCAYTTRVGTGSGTKTARLRKNFALTRKKDLTLVAFARILAQVTPIESKLHFATGARAPKFSIEQAPAGVPRGTSPGPNENGSHHASWSHRVASRFLMPRFLLA